MNREELIYHLRWTQETLEQLHYASRRLEAEFGHRLLPEQRIPMLFRFILLIGTAYPLSLLLSRGFKAGWPLFDERMAGPLYYIPMWILAAWPFYQYRVLARVNVLLQRRYRSKYPEAYEELRQTVLRLEQELAARCLVPDEYRLPGILRQFVSYAMSGRAASIRECILLYETDPN